MQQPAKDSDVVALVDQIEQAAYVLTGITISECVFVHEGQFPETPSGKCKGSNAPKSPPVALATAVGA
jgi:hypothetical protein